MEADKLYSWSSILLRFANEKHTRRPMLSCKSYGSLDACDDLVGKFRVGQLLGEGSHARVYRATHEPTKTQCAVKVLNLMEHGSSDVASIEAAALSRLAPLRHVPRLHSVIDENDGRYIFMEFAGATSLQKIVNARAHVGLSDGPLSRISRQLLLTLRACHSRGVAHGDVKLNNVMISGGAAKLIDFGCAVVADSPFSSTTLGAACFRPPESFDDRYTIDLHSVKLADAWGAGLCILCMCTGTYPFAGETVSDIIDSIRATPPDDLAASVSDLGLRVVVRGLLGAAEERWSITRALESRYMKRGLRQYISDRMFCL